MIDRACLDARPAAARTAPAARAGDGSGPAPLSGGACQAQAPTGKSRGRTVFMDAGHGGADPGVLGRSTSRAVVKESVVALAVALELSRQLRADGYRVVLARTTDAPVVRFASDELAGGAMSSEQVRRDLQARVDCANGSGAAALLSIHFNGYPDPSVGGSQTIYDAARPFSDDSRRLAAGVHSALLSRLQLADRGLVTDDDLQAPTLSEGAGSYGHLLLLGPPRAGWLDRGTAMPGVLVEPLFLTAPAEAALASSPSGQRRIASALAAGLESFLAGGAAQ